MSQQTLSDGLEELSKHLMPQRTRETPWTRSYDEYMRSARWERRKVAYFTKHPKVCRACGGTEDIHLHHHTYKRMGHEHDDDLIPLCRPHHTVVHQLHRSAAGKMTLTAATREVVGGPLHPPRRRKKPKPEVKKPKPEVKKKTVDHRPMTTRLVGFDFLVETFNVTKGTLRQQGYRKGVPASTVATWRDNGYPIWLGGVRDERGLEKTLITVDQQVRCMP